MRPTVRGKGQREGEEVSEASVPSFSSGEELVKRQGTKNNSNCFYGNKRR